ncbi:MAG: hypothetical protein U1A72_12670 [Sulfuritalea sp.]|nr:hypothetical protein [Sulfuritalea sp.]
MNSTEKKQLEAALQALRIIHTWASVDADSLTVIEPREKVMRAIANMAARGLGRADLILPGSRYP